ncbi:Phage tail protein X (GpX) [Salmonella sp. NCTC 11881]|nr:Phage tail protein X (GpX) [Salmonella sp. NCTC 11881]
MKVRAHQYDTVDALCWRHYGRTQGVTEQVLHANPGLAEYGPFFTARAAGGAAGHYGVNHGADRPAMGLNYDA